MYFFYRASLRGDQWQPVTLISLYSAPDPALLEISSGVLLMCQYHGDDSLILVEAQAIKSVVAMVPFMEKPEALGARGQLPSGSMLSTWKVLKQFAQLLPSG